MTAPTRRNEARRVDPDRAAEFIGHFLGRNLRRIRDRLGLSRGDFAERLETTQASIHRRESGRGWSDMKKVAQLIARVNVHPLEIFGLTHEELSLIEGWRRLPVGERTRLLRQLAPEFEPPPPPPPLHHPRCG